MVCLGLPWHYSWWLLAAYTSPQLLCAEGSFPSMPGKAWATRSLNLFAERVWYEEGVNAWFCSFVQAHINQLHRDRGSSEPGLWGWAVRAEHSWPFGVAVRCRLDGCCEACGAAQSVWAGGWGIVGAWGHSLCFTVPTALLLPLWGPRRQWSQRKALPGGSLVLSENWGCSGWKPRGRYSWDWSLIGKLNNKGEKDYEGVSPSFLSGYIPWCWQTSSLD